MWTSWRRARRRMARNPFSSVDLGDRSVTKDPVPRVPQRIPYERPVARGRDAGFWDGTGRRGVGDEVKDDVDEGQVRVLGDDDVP